MYLPPRTVDTRLALAQIPGALSDVIPPELAREDGEPEYIHDPAAAANRALDEPLPAFDGADEDEPVDGDDFSAVRFEVPPTLEHQSASVCLTGDVEGELRRNFQARGIDAIGFYTPFHYRGLQNGITIRKDGLLFYVWLLEEKGLSTGIPLSVRLKIAFEAVLRHEAFHLAAECMAANWELLLGEPVYLPFKERWREVLYGDPNAFPSLPYVPLEEALANAYELRRLRWPPKEFRGTKSYGPLKAVCEASPTGYRDGPRYTGTAAFYRGCARYAQAYFNVTRTAKARDFPTVYDFTSLYPSLTPIEWRRTAIALIDKEKVFYNNDIHVDFIAAVPFLEETRQFLSELHRLDGNVNRRWEDTKRKLAQSTGLDGLDFKKWPGGGKGAYSVRVTRAIRAHLSQRQEDGVWLAESIGRHKEMGHG